MLVVLEAEKSLARRDGQPRVTREARVGDGQAAQVEPRASIVADDPSVRAIPAEPDRVGAGLPGARRIVHHAEMFTSEAVTRGVRVSVQSEYAPERSQPARNQWFFLYTVTISNEGTESVQLLTRHWVITDGAGHVEEHRGPGVVGKQPVLRPGESFEYTSGTPLPTPNGIMVGSYRMVTTAGEHFDVAIPAFSLDAPGKPTRLH